MSILESVASNLIVNTIRRVGRAIGARFRPKRPLNILAEPKAVGDTAYVAITNVGDVAYFSAELIGLQGAEIAASPPWPVCWENWTRARKRLAHEEMHYLEIGRVDPIFGSSESVDELEYGMVFFASPEADAHSARLPVGDTTWLEDLYTGWMIITLLLKTDDAEMTMDYAIGMTIKDGKAIARIRRHGGPPNAKSMNQT